MSTIQRQADEIVALLTRAADGVVDDHGHLHAPKGLGKLSGRFAGMGGLPGRVEGRDLTEWARANSRKLAKAEHELDENSLYENFQRDHVLLALAKEQGWDALPEVVSSDALTNLIRSGGATEMWRGISDHPDVQPVWGWGPDEGMPYGNWHPGRTPRAHHQRNREGPLQFGRGMYGNGNYFTVSEKVGNRYGNKPTGWVDELAAGRELGPSEAGSVQRAALRADARVADYDALLAQFKRDKASLPPAVRRDLSRYAAMLGFDAVRLVNKHDMHPPTFQDQYILLNRSAAVFEHMKGIDNDA